MPAIRCALIWQPAARWRSKMASFLAVALRHLTITTSRFAGTRQAEYRVSRTCSVSPSRTAGCADQLKRTGSIATTRAWQCFPRRADCRRRPLDKCEASISTMYEPKPDPMIARDFVGYGEFPPDPALPGGASGAVNF